MDINTDANLMPFNYFELKLCNISTFSSNLNKKQKNLFMEVINKRQDKINNR